jgi:hypothetical protein
MRTLNSLAICIAQKRGDPKIALPGYFGAARLSSDPRP